MSIEKVRKIRSGSELKQNFDLDLDLDLEKKFRYISQLDLYHNHLVQY